MCRAQERTVRALIEDNEVYANIRVIGIDMHIHGRSRITSEMKVVHHSTMVTFRDGREVARLVGHVGRKQIEELIKTALGDA